MEGFQPVAEIELTLWPGPDREHDFPGWALRARRYAIRWLSALAEHQMGWSSGRMGADLTIQEEQIRVAKEAVWSTF